MLFDATSIRIDVIRHDIDDDIDDGIDVESIQIQVAR